MRTARRDSGDGRVGEPGVNPLVARVGRGLVVSVATTLLTASILVALAVGAGVRAGVANVVAVICGIGPSYVGNRRFVWRCEGRASLVNEVLPFWTLSLAGLATSTVAVARVAAWSHGRSATLRAIALPTASLAVFGSLWIVQFLLCDRVIFRQRRATVVTASAKQRSTRERAWGVVSRHAGVEGGTTLRLLLTVAVLTALVVHVGASRSARATGVSSAGGLSVFVGYAEDIEINTPDPASFPVPWAGAPNVTFLGGTVPGQTACGSLTLCYDAGAIRLDNAGSSAITVGRVSVGDHSSVSGGKVFNNL